MCGIIGLVGKNLDNLPLGTEKGMLEALHQRGPDDQGSLRDQSTILGQTRLSIIDLGNGHQPMRDNQFPFTITFNGEIYNYRSLRRELESKGHHFSTESDTEVILKAYREYGEACPSYLEGMFAFAIWDEQKQQLFCARDRFGEKPFYYAQEGTLFIFASEIKALLASGLVHPELDQTAIDNYLTLLYIPPWRTLYRNIRPLPPAHAATFKDGVWRETCYWKLRKHALRISRSDAAQEIRRLLTTSVRDRLLAADVEVGTFLSGGIDSSIVSALAAQATDRKIKTFSAGFEDLINELPYARTVAGKIGSTHHEAQINADLVETYREVTRYFDEPFADSSNIPTSLIAAFARPHIKTILSGDGGDELFWGYGHYRRHYHLPKFQKIALFLSSNPFQSYKHYLQVWTLEERSRLWKDTHSIEADPAERVDVSEGETPLEKINLVDLSMALPGDMLTKVDRASMMHSLEVRAPFLDHHLAEFAFNLPAEYKTDRHRGKLILAEAFSDLLPPEVFTRKKQGFGAPIGQWLQKPAFRLLVNETLTERCYLTNLFHWDEIKKVLASFYAGNTALQHKVWTLLSLELWFQTHQR